MDISPDQIDQFQRDGATCLRNLVDAATVARLQAASDRITADRKAAAGRIDFGKAGEKGRYLSDLYVWRQDADFRDFVLHGPNAAAAGALLGASKINVLFDHLLVKEPGTSAPTAWHHDLPFWPIDGRQVLTIWLALDRVTKDSGAVECIAGSHLWPERWRPVQPDTPETRAMVNMDLPKCPNFSAEREKHRILLWELEPGDAIAFHALTIHGSGGNFATDRQRRGLATRWCGDDITYIPGHFALPVFEETGLKRGDPLDSDLFPVVWRRAA